MSFTAIKPGGWTVGDSLLAGQVNSMQTNMLNSFDILGGGNTCAGSNFFNGSNVHHQANLDNTTIKTSHSNIFIIIGQSLADLRSTTSLTDGQIFCLLDSSTYIYNSRIFYRYDSSDSSTVDFYKKTGSDSKLSYYAIKPNTIANGSPGVWKPINNIGFAKEFDIQLSNTANKVLSSIPANSSWTSNNQFEFNADLGFSTSSIFTTDLTIANSNGYTLIPKAENYYDVDISYCAPFAFNYGYSAGNILFGCLTALITTPSANWYPGQLNSLTNVNPNWQAITPAYNGSTNYATYTALNQNFKLKSSTTSYDIIKFYLGVSASTTGISGGIVNTYPQNTYISITAY